MPIIPCFDPTTGASGGPSSGGGGGGGGLYNIDLTEIDLTDGTWTLEDKDSLVQSVTFAGGFNTVTWNALTGANLYRWDSGSDCRSPRWYKDISVESNTITNGDYLIQSMKMELDKTVADFPQMVVVGSGMNPTSQVLNDIRLMGGVMRRNTTGNVVYGAFANNTFTGNGDSDNVYGLVTNPRGLTAMGTSCFINTDALNSPVLFGGQGSRNGQINSGQLASTTMRIIVGIGIAGSTTNVTAGDQQKFKVSVTSLTVNMGA